MKELSIEQKAKAYDEAVINGSRLWECGEITRENYEYIFPELKESEDEEIRKWLIELVEEIRKANPTNADHNGMCSEAVAWLEKQDEPSIYAVPSRNIILAVWELGNDWKELTKGRISTEHGTQLEYIQKHWNESEYYLREKQGEQQPADKVEPKFKKD